MQKDGSKQTQTLLFLCQISSMSTEEELNTTV